MPTPMADTQTNEPTAPPTTDQRLAAMELLLQQLVLVLECEPTFSAEALRRWGDLARQRMEATQSVGPGTLEALTQLQRRVLA